LCTIFAGWNDLVINMAGFSCKQGGNMEIGGTHSIMGMRTDYAAQGRAPREIPASQWDTSQGFLSTLS
jgi:hypothetical protein